MKKIVLLYDGINISNRNQSRALAFALKSNLISHVVVEHNLLKTRQPLLDSISNSIIIGCGRKSALVNMRLSLYKSQRNNQTIQILHPRIPFFSTYLFDCLIIPTHDRLSIIDDPKKIVFMNGSLSWGLDQASLKYFERNSQLNGIRKMYGNGTKIVTVLVGGEIDNIEQITAELIRLEQQQKDLKVVIVCSRRTFQKVGNYLSTLKFSFIWTFQSKQKNPFRELLAISDFFIVSKDSISMISDVLTVIGERKLQIPIFLLKATSTTREKHLKFVQLTKERSLNSNFVHDFTSAEDFFTIIQGNYFFPFENEIFRVGKIVTKQCLNQLR